ncbi:structural maintenance of chromosomes protein 5 [Entomortierella parvispora]|uniref:Structural maintenance of chromosomes protein 5 n=1 Tax=Entomortierella parvispora TaxID=205924 RepID=A0A9P3LT25_9FUNG|nr:structural maintenance of chromosomes protein 5 [Entomortierella parvispora]
MLMDTTVNSGAVPKRRREIEPEEVDHDGVSQELAIPRNKGLSSVSSNIVKSEYQHGSIMRVSMKSFVTYESCSFTPGPNLNMIIGPNGTGKSTIVCALALGLGWNTNLLGRAKEISEFVKHGSDKGWIEVVLCNKNGTNVVIKRHINKTNNTSVWKINGENKTQKEVMKKVQSFNIQVDNLCQFLPQDRVSEFAQMTPQELLKETQRAIGGDEMVAAHQKMIDLWNEHKTISASVQGDLDHIETNEKRNAVIAKDVLRFQQREAVLKKVRLLEIWILYAKYGRAKDDYNAIKETRRVSYAMFNQLQREVEPLEDKTRQLEQSEKRFADEKSRLEKQYQDSVRNLKAKGTAIETAEGEAEDLKKELDRLQAKVQQRQTTINNMKRKIAAHQELVDGAPSEETVNNEKEELQQQIASLIADNHSTRERIDSLQSQQQEIVNASSRINHKMTETRRSLNELDDVSKRRLDQLGRNDPDAREAVLWLRDNANIFQKKVFEPVCLELNIRNTKFVNAVENALRNQLKTFVCQTREDYNLFTREILDKRKLRVNVIAPRPQELELDEYRPPVPASQLAGFGFDCYMLDAVDGPPALLAAMCSKAGIHAIPVSQSASVHQQAIRDSGKFKRYATSTTAFQISYSRYSGESLDTATPLKSANVFTSSVDHEARAKLITEMDDLRSNLERNEHTIHDLTKEEKDLRKTYQEFTAKRDALNEAKKTLIASLKRTEKLKIDLDSMKRDLERRLREPSTEEEEEKINKALRVKSAKRCKLTLEYLELGKVCHHLFSRVTLTTLSRVQAHAESQAVEVECAEKARQLKDMEDQYTEANRQYEKVRGEAKELLDTAKEQYSQLDPALIPEFKELGAGASLEQLEDMLAGESAKAALHYTPNQSVIDKYEKQQGDIKTAKEKVESKKRKLGRLESEIQQIRGSWYPKITELIARISNDFSKSFQRIGCAGEVKLGEHEDYDKWCIEILVKFRDAEKLQKLTGQRQSGGERSVSTIMYLMALQELSQVSFRVVDEINQGMDPRNERLVHAQLVEKACKKDTAQYFLITPKLLPNLDYHERMKVLCIYNGEWLDDGVTKWSNYLNNQRQSKKIRA